MRIRSKVKEAALKRLPSGTFQCAVYSSSMSDQNNGRNRPSSPVAHKQGFYSPTLVAAYAWRETEPYGHVNIPADYIADTVESLSDSHRQTAESICISRLHARIAEFSSQFSSLNFAYELREIGSLFKAIEKYRFIDWQFGISPMIADLKKAVTEFESLAKSSKQKAWENSFPFNTTKRISVNEAGPGTPFAGNPHSEDYNIILTSKIKGTITVGKPYLAHVNPGLFQALDSLAVDPSAGNAWEAIPWSWFIDWFLPVGKTLDSFPSLMKPEIAFSGSLSTKIRGFGSFTSIRSGPAWVFNGGDFAGIGRAKIYYRTPLTGVPAVPFRFTVDSLSNPVNIALLRDIAFPVKRA